jgi:hypothetical protein
MLAAHNTRVDPNATRHEPSAYPTAPRSSTTGRKSAGARPVRGVASARATRTLQQPGRGMPRRQRYNDHLASPRPDFGRSDNRGFSVVATFDQDVRCQRRDQRQRRVLVEDDYRVDCCQRRDDMGPVISCVERTARTLQPAHGVVAIDADDEVVTCRARRSQQVRVPAMQQVENAVGEDDRPALACTPLQGSGSRQNARRRPARRQKSPSACGLK